MMLLSGSSYFLLEVEETSLIHVMDLSFSYEGSPDCVFENVSFQIDAEWRLGFTGRNIKKDTARLSAAGRSAAASAFWLIRGSALPYAEKMAAENPACKS